jgi:hypothetical protein
MRAILRYLVLPVAVVIAVGVLLVWSVKLFPVYALSVIALATAGALIRGWLHASDERDAGWRVRHHGRDQICYEELRNDRWDRIIFDGSMLTGHCHHEIYLNACVIPDWAASRREEIIVRMQTKFSPPGYRYVGP